MSYRTFEIFKSTAYVFAVVGGINGYHTTKYNTNFDKFMNTSINITYGATIGYFYPLTIPLLYSKLIRFPYL